MSYAIAPTFEGNRMGVRRLSVLSGAGHMLGGLGDVSATAQTLIDNGADPGIINTLLAMGATDAQLTALLNGQTDAIALMNQLTPSPTPIPPGLTSPGVMPSAAVNPVSPPPVSSPNMVQTALTTQPAPPNPASAPQSPQGSTLLYTATFNAAAALALASGVISAISAQLPTHYMTVISSNVLASGLTSAASFTLTIMDSVGHQYLSDAQSVVDSYLQAATRNSKISSAIVVVSAGGTIPAKNPLTIDSSLLGTNWPWLVGGGLAFLLVGIILGKKT